MRFVIGACILVANAWAFVVLVRVIRARRRLQALRDHHESMWP